MNYAKNNLVSVKSLQKQRNKQPRRERSWCRVPGVRDCFCTSGTNEVRGNAPRTILFRRDCRKKEEKRLKCVLVSGPCKDVSCSSDTERDKTTATRPKFFFWQGIKPQRQTRVKGLSLCEDVFCNKESNGDKWTAPPPKFASVEKLNDQSPQSRVTVLTSSPSERVFCELEKTSIDRRA
jgi:hypothetical protein